MRIPSLFLLLAFTVPASAKDLPAWAQPGDSRSELSPEPPPSRFMPSPDPEGPDIARMPPCPPTGCTTTPTQVPVDGGLGLLALAGASYAVRRLRRRPD